MKDVLFFSLFPSTSEVKEEIDDCGFTPLSDAAFDGDIKTVTQLLEKGQSAYSKNIALLMACQADHADIVKLLIKHKADVNVDMENYHTPLFQAITNKKINAFNELIKAPDIKLEAEGRDGIIPILLAAFNGRLDIVKCLVEEKGVNPKIKNAKGQTAIEMASMNKKASVVEYLTKISQTIQLKK